MSIKEIFQRSVQRGIHLLRIVRSKNNQELSRLHPRNECDALTGFGHLKQIIWANNNYNLAGLARKIWYSNCKESLASCLRRRAGWDFISQQFRGRQTVPLLGLVGLTMVSTSGVGLITDHDEFSALCEQIRITMTEISSDLKEEDYSRTNKKTLENFSIGSMIAKGCNAVVYSAKEKLLKTDEQSALMHSENVLIRNEHHQPEEVQGKFSEYPLALKMMFNYDAESNAPVILRAMYRETLPAKYLMLSQDPASIWEAARFLKSLPYHPNIVDMKYVFADRVPTLPEQQQIYPQALPTRIYPDGCGRNMTLFLVMKRYHKSLKEYLETYTPSTQTSVLLVTQLLEGVYHLNRNGISHRDLKSDNILLDLSDGPNLPRLVITDFGCCSTNMCIPFPSIHLDQREGNVAMMAPEVSTAIPGPFSNIDYSTADLWAIGALAYEIFGHRNPFYTTRVHEQVFQRLDSRAYKDEDLPQLSAGAPNVVNFLIRNLLSRQPSKRMPIGVAANICHLLLLAPPHWLVTMGPVPSEEIIARWLVLLAASCAVSNRHIVLDSVKQTFLRRVKIEEVTAALQFIRLYS